MDFVDFPSEDLIRAQEAQGGWWEFWSGIEGDETDICRLTSKHLEFWRNQKWILSHRWRPYVRKSEA